MQIVLPGSCTRFVCSDQCTSLWAVPDVMMSSAGRAQSRDKAEIHGVDINEKRVEEHELWECHLVADTSFGMYAIFFRVYLLPELVIWLGKESIWCTANQWLEMMDLERSSVVISTSLVSLASDILSLCKRFLYTQISCCAVQTSCLA